MLVGARLIIIIELLQKRTFEDVLFFCVMKMWFVVGVEKSGNCEKFPGDYKQAGENQGKGEKYPAGGKQAGENQGKCEKYPAGEKQAG